MAEASVTIKLSPAEFDLVRDSVSLALNETKEQIADMSADSTERAKARARGLCLGLLGAKLNA